MKFYSFLLIFAGSVGSFTAKAQDTRNYNVQNRATQSGNEGYIDQNGNQYFIDSEGYPYYIDRQGKPFYIDQDGNIYYADRNGNFYYLDKDGQPYYIDKDGNPFYLDQKGNPIYRNQQKEQYYPENQSKQYNDDIYPDTARGKYRAYQAKMNRQQETTEPYLTNVEFDKFRIAAGGGYSFRLGERQKSPYPEEDQALKDLMHGFNIDADIQYFFKKDMGVGATFNYLETSASLYDTKQTFIYIGPSFIGRSDINKSFSFFYNIGVGPLFYKESSSKYYDYTKTTFGMNAGISGEYRISQNIGIGLKLYYIVGTVGSLNYNGSSIDLGERQNVSSIGFTGFISFRTK